MILQSWNKQFVITCKPFSEFI